MLVNVVTINQKCRYYQRFFFFHVIVSRRDIFILATSERSITNKTTKQILSDVNAANENAEKLYYFAQLQEHYAILGW